MVTSKTKVLIIGATPPPYNGMSVATELVLKAVGDEFCVIHLDLADRRPLSNIGRIDVRNVLLAAYHGLKYLWLLLIKDPDIVYLPVAQDRLAFLRDSLFLIPARLLRKKVVVHLHGGYFATFYRLASVPMKGFIRYCLGRSARAVVLGTSLENMFQGVLPPERIRVIPNGIPDHFADAQHRPNNGHRRTILFLSTLMKAKGVFDVLKALPAIGNRVPDVRAVFAGEWYRAEDEQAAQEIVRDFNLESQVEFIGPVMPSRKNEVLRDADLFVLPSQSEEGHPFAILEAMSAGLPVVSTNVGCIPETVINEVNGFIVNPGNGEELASRMASLLTDDNLRRRMGEASRSRFLEQYSLDRFSAQMRELFAEVAA